MIPLEALILPEPVMEIFGNCNAWIVLVTFAFTGGFMIASKSAAVGSLIGVIVFTYLAPNTPFLNNLMYLMVLLMSVAVAFKFWRLEVGGMG